MITLYDIHTHTSLTRLPYNSDTYRVKYILNTLPNQIKETLGTNPNSLYSCGIHPWFSNDWEDQFIVLKEVSINPSIVAIGECGLDKLKGLSMDIQIDIFKRHIELSEQVEKPLIIHCVRAWDIIVSVYKEMKPKQHWVLHGFRGKPMLARQLAQLGFYFSIGDKFNHKSIAEIPIDNIFCETDESLATIIDVYNDVASVLNLSVSDLATNINANVKDVFCGM